MLDYGTGCFDGDANSAVYRIDYVQGTRSPAPRSSRGPTSGPAPLDREVLLARARADPDGTPDHLRLGPRRRRHDRLDGRQPDVHLQRAGRYTATLDGHRRRRPDRQRVGEHRRRQHARRPSRSPCPPPAASSSTATTIPYRITVTDPEDGTIDCDRVRLDTALGHNEHSHGDQNLTGCSGQVTIPAAWEDKTQHIFYVLTASYTDDGGAGPGLELTGTAQVDPRAQGPAGRVRRRPAGDAERQQRRRRRRPARRLHPGRRLAALRRHRPSGIDSVARARHLRRPRRLRAPRRLADRPARRHGRRPQHRRRRQLRRPAAVPITDPGGTHDLFVVFTAARWTSTSSPSIGLGRDRQREPGARRERHADLRLGAAGGRTSTPRRPTRGQPVTFDVGLRRLRRADGHDRLRRRTPTRERAPTSRASPRPTATGAAACAGSRSTRARRLRHAAPTVRQQRARPHVWSEIVREDAYDYRVENGGLVIDAVAGDMYGANTARAT